MARSIVSSNVCASDFAPPYRIMWLRWRLSPGGITAPADGRNPISPINQPVLVFPVCAQLIVYPVTVVTT